MLSLSIISMCVIVLMVIRLACSLCFLLMEYQLYWTMFCWICLQQCIEQWLSYNVWESYV